MISIIVPVYKVEKYLSRCIDSILAQTYQDFELILVDDGSPDSCGMICEQYAQTDQRIVVIHKENGGLSDARNAGIEIARGEYIGFVDSDDYIDPKMYEILYENMINLDADISMCGYYDIFEDTEKKSTQCTNEQIYVWNKETAIKEILIGKRLGVHAPTKLYKKALFNFIRYPVGYVSEDTFIVMDIFDSVQTAVFVERPLYYYYHRSESINTSNFNDKDLTRFAAFEKNCKFIKENFPDLLGLAEDKYLNEQYLVGRKILLSKEYEQYNSELSGLRRNLKKNIIRIARSTFWTAERKTMIFCLAWCPRLYQILLRRKYS